MQAIETPRNGAAALATGLRRVSHRVPSYQKVLDGRKHPVRGLWVRNGRYYARLSFEDPQTGEKEVRRIALKAGTVAQAQSELRRLQTRREDRELPVLRRTPRFADYVRRYLAYYEQAHDAKRASTLETERVHLRAWEKHLGHVRLENITPKRILDYVAKRQGDGASGRTVNLAVTILRNVLKMARHEGWLKTLPTENLQRINWVPKKRPLYTTEQINKICESAPKVSKNGIQFADYVKLMASGGSRMTETLALKWPDVDWVNRQLTIGADGNTKNRQARVVDFNPQLEAHLRDMLTRRSPDPQWCSRCTRSCRPASDCRRDTSDTGDSRHTLRSPRRRATG